MPFTDFTNPYRDPATALEEYRNHSFGKNIKANKVCIKGSDIVFVRIEPWIYDLKIALILAEIK